MMKSLLRHVAMVIVLILSSSFFAVYSAAEENANPYLLSLLEGSEGNSKQYLVQLSGTVMNETFSGAQVLLTLMGASPGSPYDNSYLVTVQGFPSLNSRNTFFWNSGYSEMTSIANAITCDIKRTFIKPVPMYFQFLSPSKLKDFDRREAEKLAGKVALPTEIKAQAGQLKLKVHADSISGTVWMKGYDPWEKAYVQYGARLYGKKFSKLILAPLEKPIPLGKQ